MTEGEGGKSALFQFEPPIATKLFPNSCRLHVNGTMGGDFLLEIASIKRGIIFPDWYGVYISAADLRTILRHTAQCLPVPAHASKLEELMHRPEVAR